MTLRSTVPHRPRWLSAAIWLGLAVLVLAAVPATSVADRAATPGEGHFESNAALGAGKGPIPSLYPVRALGARSGPEGAGGSCDDCAYYMQEWTTLLEGCQTGDTGSCTVTGLPTLYEEVAVPTSPYATGVELNGLTNTGDWIQATVLLNWCGDGYYVAQEDWNNAGDSVYGVACFTPFTISAGNTIELGLTILATGVDAGDVCISAADLTTHSTTFTNCLAQPDPGATPDSNYFVFNSGNGYFTGPMTEIVDTSASSCLDYDSMPEVTYNFLSGTYITEFAPGSDEWNPDTDAICYAPETPTWTMAPGDASFLDGDASGGSTYGPHWEAARNTSTLAPSTWWSFSTDFLLPTPTVAPASADVGQATSVVFNEPVQVDHVDSNPTYSGWSTPASVLSGCTTSDSGQTYTCSPTGPAGAVGVKFDLGETGGHEAFSPTITYTLYADPTVTEPTPSRPSADAGQSVTFSATAANGSGGLTVSWAGLPSGCSGTTLTVVCADVTATSGTSITVTVTDSNGFQVTSPALLYVVYPAPTVTLSASPSSTDTGTSVQFVATPVGGSGGWSYVWTGLPSNCPSVDTAQLSCAPSTVGSYHVVVNVTDSNGEVASANASLSVHSPSPSSPSSPSLPGVTGTGGTELLILLGAVIVAVAVGVAVAARRRKKPARGPPTPFQGPPS